MFNSRLKQKRFNAWERSPVRCYSSLDEMDYYLGLAEIYRSFEHIECNAHLDIRTKSAALKASPSVVALVSYSGEQEIIRGCGTIVEVADNNRGIILTSANVIRNPIQGEFMENNLAANLKIIVYLSDGKSYEGEEYAHDFHYNIAAISFKSDCALATARLAQLDDYISVDPSQLSSPTGKPFQLYPHSSSFNLVPGDPVIVVGRYSSKLCELMAAPGVFSLDRCEYECKELFSCGEGSPLINYAGDIIGISFYDQGFTPFMPVNIVKKWWENYKRYRQFRRPFLGVEATNLYAADVDVIEKLIQKFPCICNGVFVEKVVPHFSADLAGIRPDDVIVQCGGKAVRSFLQFFEIILDNVGNLLEVVVARSDQTTPLHLNMVVGEAKPDKLYRWPCIHPYCKVFLN